MNRNRRVIEMFVKLGISTHIREVVQFRSGNPRNSIIQVPDKVPSVVRLYQPAVRPRNPQLVESTVEILELLDRLTDPLFPVPSGLRAWPHAMLPFHPIVVCADDHVGRLSTLDPIHHAQDDIMIRLVDPVGIPTDDGTLTDLPRARTPVTVTHAGHHEQSIEFVHLAVTTSSWPACTKIS